MPAGSLQAAAEQCYSHMFVYWTAGTLDAKFAAFNAACIAAFPSQVGDNDVKQRTVSNWFVIGRQIENAGGITTSQQFNDAVMYVFRLCLAGFAARPAVGDRISTAQATALLAAYNANLD